MVTPLSSPTKASPILCSNFHVTRHRVQILWARASESESMQVRVVENKVSIPTLSLSLTLESIAAWTQVLLITGTDRGVQ